jgi:hypothetical protein
MSVETPAQWDDEWWRIWKANAHAGMDGEAAAAHADVEMSERHGLRPAEPPLGASAAIAKIGELGRAAIVEIGELAKRPSPDRLDDLLAEVDVVNDPLPIKLENSAARFVPVEPWTSYVEVTPGRDGFMYTFGEHLERKRGLRYEQLIIERMQAQIDGRRVWTAADPAPRRGWLGRLLDRMFGGSA